MKNNLIGLKELNETDTRIDSCDFLKIDVVSDFVLCDCLIICKYRSLHFNLYVLTGAMSDKTC